MVSKTPESVRELTSLASVEDIGDAVSRIAQFRPTPAIERRSGLRHPYPALIRMTPIDASGDSTDESVFVVGKDLASTGIGFFHTSPLPYRRVIASFQHRDGWTHFLVDISWCRFLSPGWYDSGGRFIKIVDWQGT